MWRAVSTTMVGCIYIAEAKLLDPSVTLPSGYLNLTQYWPDVPTLTASKSKPKVDKVPAGCECVGLEFYGQACTLFDCKCTCDVTARACDPNCCCDTECNADQLKIFYDAGTCLPEPPSYPLGLHYCSGGGQMGAKDMFQSSLTAFGKIGATQGESSPWNPFLCVVNNNSPSKGTFIADPGSKSGEAGSTLIDAAISNPSFPLYTFEEKAITKPISRLYRKNDVVIAGAANRANSTGSLMNRSGGYLPLSAPGLDGQCTDTNLAKFNVDSNNKCYRSITASSLKKDCTNVFSVSYLVKDLLIGRIPAAQLPNPDTYIPVTLNKISYENGAAFNGPIGGNATTVDTTLTTNLQCAAKCVNAVRRIEYSVKYTFRGAIASASADVFLTNIDLCNATTTPEVLFTQETSVAFIASDEKNMVIPPSNLVRRRKSGNPGYVNGLPLPTGVEEKKANKTAVAMFQDGFALLAPSPVDGTCSKNSKTEVLFGTDTLSSCTMKLKVDELKALCTSPNPIPPLLTVPKTLIGIYGNADPLIVDQWIPLVDSNLAGKILPGLSPNTQVCSDPSFNCIKRPGCCPVGTSCYTKDTKTAFCKPTVQKCAYNETITTAAANNASLPVTKSTPWTCKNLSPSRQWNEELKTCTNIISAIHVEFLYTKVGTATNMQNKIVAARYRYSPSTWSVANAVTSTVKTTSTFTVKATASFIYMKPSALEPVVPPVPKLIPGLPEEVYYPLRILSARYNNANVALSSPSSIAVPSPVLMMVAAVVASVLLCK